MSVAIGGAGRLPGEGHVRGGRAVAEEGFVGGESIVDRTRVRMLGGEPVVHHRDHSGARPPAELWGQLCREEGVQWVPPQSIVLESTTAPPPRHGRGVILMNTHVDQVAIVTTATAPRPAALRTGPSDRA